MRARIAQRLELERFAQQQAGLQGGTEEGDDFFPFPRTLSGKLDISGKPIEDGSQSGTEDGYKFEEIEEGEGEMEEDDPAMAAIVK